MSGACSVATHQIIRDREDTHSAQIFSNWGHVASRYERKHSWGNTWKLKGYMLKCTFYWPGVCQACRRVAVHYVFARCVPGVRQACTRRACVRCASGHQCAPGVRQTCARRALGCVPGVRQACSDILPTCRIYWPPSRFAVNVSWQIISYYNFSLHADDCIWCTLNKSWQFYLDNKWTLKIFSDTNPRDCRWCFYRKGRCTRTVRVPLYLALKYSAAALLLLLTMWLSICHTSSTQVRPNQRLKISETCSMLVIQPKIVYQN